MKIINVGIDDKRWGKLKAIADGERRHIKHQAALVLENWIDGQGGEPCAGGGGRNSNGKPGASRR